MRSNMTTAELARIIRLAVAGDTKSIFEIILQFQFLIIKESYINGKFSQECKDYIEDKIFSEIKKFKKI